MKIRHSPAANKHLALFAALILIFQGLVFGAESANRPNIVMVLIDDMGWSDLSCFGGNAVETTNIDRLAQQGIRFTNFYVASPICSPSRTAITTGQYPERWRITSYLADRARNTNRGMAQWLDPKAPTLARCLQKAGYATGHFGKWHMGGQRDVGDAPLITEYGFDTSLTSFEGLGPRVLPLCDAFDGKPPVPHALGSDKLGRGPIRWVDRSKETTVFVDAAIDFMRKAQKEGKPFYVNVFPDDVHSPFFPPAALRGDGKKRTLYDGVVKATDDQLAPLFNFIESEPGLRDNTLLILASDNGPEPGAGSADPLRGNKGDLYEGGIREPFIVWGPKFIEADKRGTINTKSVLVSMDIAPTVLKFAGIPAEGVTFDGAQSLDVFLGHTQDQPERQIFWRRPPDHPYIWGDHPATSRETAPDLAVREGPWKLLVQYDGSDPQLYNLVNEQEEKTNLAAQYPAIVKRLSNAVMQWNESMPQDRHGRDVWAAPPPKMDAQ